MLLAIALVVSMLGTTVLAAKPVGPSQFDLIWAAIADLGTQLTNLQTKTNSLQSNFTNFKNEMEARLPSTTNVSVPAAAFKTSLSYVAPDIINYGNYLTSNYGGEAYLVAEVQLPQGANITQLIIYWRDTNPSEDIRLTLQSAEAGSSGTNAISTASSGLSSLSEIKSTTVKVYSTNLVDNGKCFYYLLLTIPGINLNYGWTSNFYGAFIEYKL